MNKISVAVVAYNRPNYLQQALKSLSSCEGFTSIIDNVTVSIDDGVFDPEARACVEVARQWIASSIDLRVQTATIIAQPRRRGIVGNTILAMKSCFDQGSLAVIMLEDDAILGADALHLASWFNDQDHGKYLLSGFSYWPKAKLPKEPWSERNASEINLHPCPFAYFVHYSNWPFLRRHWGCKNYVPCGWSWSITYAARLADRARFLFPHEPRVINIGREKGTNESPTSWDLTQKGISLYDGPYRGCYKILNTISHEEAGKIDEWMYSEIDADPNQKCDGWLGFGRPSELNKIQA